MHHRLAKHADIKPKPIKKVLLGIKKLHSKPENSPHEIFL